jgi:hypothetical protein
MPHFEKFPVSVEYEGNLYQGEQIVEGKTHRYQTVTFQGRTKKDSYRYLHHETNYMNLTAQHLLIEIVKELSSGL